MVTWEMFYGTGYFRRLFGHSTTRELLLESKDYVARDTP